MLRRSRWSNIASHKVLDAEGPSHSHKAGHYTMTLHTLPLRHSSSHDGATKARVSRKQSPTLFPVTVVDYYYQSSRNVCRHKFLAILERYLALWRHKTARRNASVDRQSNTCWIAYVFLLSKAVSTGYSTSKTVPWKKTGIYHSFVTLPLRRRKVEKTGQKL